MKIVPTGKVAWIGSPIIGAVYAGYTFLTSDYAGGRIGEAAGAFVSGAAIYGAIPLLILCALWNFIAKRMGATRQTDKFAGRFGKLLGFAIIVLVLAGSAFVYYSMSR
jgi:hypothetical protein